MSSILYIYYINRACMYSISLLPKPAILVYGRLRDLQYIFSVTYKLLSKKRALGGSCDIGVVYIIGAPHPELLPKKVLSRTANF